MSIYLIFMSFWNDMRLAENCSRIAIKTLVAAINADGKRAASRFRQPDYRRRSRICAAFPWSRRRRRGRGSTGLLQRIKVSSALYAQLRGTNRPADQPGQSWVLSKPADRMLRYAFADLARTDDRCLARRRWYRGCNAAPGLPAGNQREDGHC